MPLLEELFRASPPGSPRVSLTIDTPAGVAFGGRPAFGCLEVLTGQVTVAGTDHWRQAGRLSLAAIEIWDEQMMGLSNRSERVHRQTILRERLPVPEPSFPAEAVPFAFTLPDVPPARSHSWYLLARLHEEQGTPLLGHDLRPFTLLASAPVRGLVACLMELGSFRLVREGRCTDLLSGENRAFRSFYDFAAPRSLLGTLDGVRLRIGEVTLPPDGDRLIGLLDINPQERGPADYLRGGRPRVRRPFEFPATPFAACAPGGAGSLDAPAVVTPPYPYLVAALRDLLHPFV